MDYRITGLPPQRFAHLLALDDDALASRLLSVRAFDPAGFMVAADIAQGTDLPALVSRFFADPQAAYLHAHYARAGCFAARIDRA